MSVKTALQLALAVVFFGWFIVTDYRERTFRRDEIFYMRDLLRELKSHHSDRGDKTKSIVLTELLEEAGETYASGPTRLRVCLDARRKIDEAMYGALKGEGVLSASVELWSIHDDSIAEFCRHAIREREPFNHQNLQETK